MHSFWISSKMKRSLLLDWWDKLVICRCHIDIDHHIIPQNNSSMYNTRYRPVNPNGFIYIFSLSDSIRDLTFHTYSHCTKHRGRFRYGIRNRHCKSIFSHTGMGTELEFQYAMMWSGHWQRAYNVHYEQAIGIWLVFDFVYYWRLLPLSK